MTEVKSIHRQKSLSSVTDEEGQGIPKSVTHSSKRISFPADSILNAVIQDGDVIDLLVILRNNKGDIDLNQTNHSGLTALHHAVLTNNLDMAKLLLNNGADVHIQDMHGLSPLHTAAAMGLLQMTSFLIMFGADVFCHSKQSELPIDLAKDISVIRLLYQEMYFRIHKELYIKTMVKLICVTLARVFCDILISMLKLMLCCLTTMYKLYYKLQPGKSFENETNVLKEHIHDTDARDSVELSADKINIPSDQQSDALDKKRV